jgi:hypothetical protein
MEVTKMPCSYEKIGKKYVKRDKDGSFKEWMSKKPQKKSYSKMYSGMTFKEPKSDMGFEAPEGKSFPKAKIPKGKFKY